MLASLRSAGEQGISGETLARDLGVSRVAVGKHIAILTELGYEIDAVPGRGYRLTGIPDRAFPWEVRPLTRDPLWRRFEGGLTTVSTNDDARTLAEQGAEEGTVVVSARQEGGRGRFGRAWSSPEGGAYVSVVLRPQVSPADAGPLALVVALGIAKGLETLGVPAGLKWPNDVKVGGGKLAGVLLEMNAEADAIRWVVAGFGLNVARPDSPRAEAAYVRDYSPNAGVAQTAAACLDGVAVMYREWLEEGFGRLLDEYESRSVLTGEHVVVSNAMGMVRVAGVVRGIDAGGRLLIEADGGTVAVASGEVTLHRDRDMATESAV